MENIAMELNAARVAFDKAIASGRLSVFHGDWNYAGDYMYMGVGAGDVDLFKHKITRNYIGKFPVMAEVMR